jgi:glucarate dehydratase
MGLTWSATPTTTSTSHWIWQEGLERLSVTPPRIADGAIAVSSSPGLGIRLDRERLLAAHELYQEKALVARDDAVGMHYFVPGWEFDGKRPRLVRLARAVSPGHQPPALSP